MQLPPILIVGLPPRIGYSTLRCTRPATFVDVIIADARGPRSRGLQHSPRRNGFGGSSE